MLQSGDLRYISNKELRQRLVGWSTLVADAVENDEMLRTIAGPRAFDYLSTRVDMGLVDLTLFCTHQRSPEGCPSTSFAVEATRELSGLASQVRGWSTEGARELEQVRQEALALVGILDTELAGR